MCAQEVLKAVTVCARGLDNIFMYNGAEGVYGPTVERERERDLDSAACQEARMTGQVWGAGAKEQGVARDVDTRATPKRAGCVRTSRDLPVAVAQGEGIDRPSSRDQA